MFLTLKRSIIVIQSSVTWKNLVSTALCDKQVFCDMAGYSPLTQ